MEATIQTKFNIGDVVSFKNHSSFNPSYDVTTIGTITAIHVYGGNGMYVGENAKGRVRYDINGHCEVRMEESRFTLIKAAQDNKE
jgi:hypothetical protein